MPGNYIQALTASLHNLWQWQQYINICQQPLKRCFYSAAPGLTRRNSHRQNSFNSTFLFLCTSFILRNSFIANYFYSRKVCPAELSRKHAFNSQAVVSEVVTDLKVTFCSRGLKLKTKRLDIKHLPWTRAAAVHLLNARGQKSSTSGDEGAQRGDVLQRTGKFLTAWEIKLLGCSKFILNKCLFY